MRLNPLDLVVALPLVEGDSTFQRLSNELCVVPSQVHSSVQRLQLAQLVRPDSRQVNRLALEEFLLHGARHAFPPVVGASARGVATAHAASLRTDVRHHGPVRLALSGWRRRRTIAGAALPRRSQAPEAMSRYVSIAHPVRRAPRGAGEGENRRARPAESGFDVTGC